MSFRQRSTCALNGGFTFWLRKAMLMRWIFFKNPLRFLEKSSKYLIITYINILDCELSNVESNTTISPIIHSTSKQTSPKSKTSPMSPIEKSKREKSEAAVKKEELPSPNISNEKYIG